VGRLLWHIQIYFTIASQFLKTRLQYRADFLINLIGTFMYTIGGIASTWLIFRSIPSLNGWSYYEMLFFLGFFQNAMLPYSMFFQSFWGLAQQIRSGDFIRYYFRPLNMMFYYTTSWVNLRGAIPGFVVSLSIMIVAGLHLHIHWTVWSVLLLIVNWFSSALIIVSILVGGMTTAFWIVNPGSLTMTMCAIRDYARFPMDIFAKGVQYVFMFVIPIGFIAFYPSLILLRPVPEVPTVAWFSPFVGFILFFLVYRLWKRGINRYTGTGS
jgi:ABC-2 type transport system permease protein